MENIKVTNFNPDDYVILMMIGKGNFSEMYLVEHKETKILYAMKLFLKARVEQIKKQEDVLMEKHVMQKIEPHGNIIGYYGSAKDEEFLYVLYEYINGGELWQKCVVYGLPNVDLVRYYFLQLLDGISHLHSYNIVHRDIKVKFFLLSTARKCYGD